MEHETEVDVMSMVDEIVNDELATTQEQKEVKQSQKTPRSDKSQDQGEDQDEEDLDFGNMANGEIRYNKVKEQKSDLARQLAETKALLEKSLDRTVAQEEVDSESDDEDDPTEYMSDEQKMLFEGYQKLAKGFDELNGRLKGIETTTTKKENQTIQDNFFERRGDLDPADTKELFLDYLSDKPEIADLFVRKKISFDALHAMSISEKSPQVIKKIADPTKVWGKGKKEPVASRKTSGSDDELVAAKRILSDPNSVNKTDAVEALIDSSISEIEDMLDAY